MAWKQQQNTLFNATIQKHKVLEKYDDFSTMIDWSKIEDLLSNIHNKIKGNHAYPPLLMFKSLLIQAWNNLSDTQLEEALVRDLLYRKFVGLDISDTAPDHSTIWRFRDRLTKQELLKPLLEEVNDQLSRQGIIVRKGSVSIIDASIVQAARSKKQTNDADENTQDPEASYHTKRNAQGVQETTYGFKFNINTDEDDFINSYDITAAHVHDSQVFEPLFTQYQVAVYADSAYKSKEHDRLLEQLENQNKIQHRAYRNKPMSEEQKLFNKSVASVRNGVERIFAIMKQHYHMDKVPYLGLKRNETFLGLRSIAMNLKRGVKIERSLCVS